MRTLWLNRAAALLLTCAAAAAQGARLRAVIAASPHRDAVPGVAWLCEDYLPTLPSWPRGLDPLAAIDVTVSSLGVEVTAAKHTPPDGALAIGAAATSGAPDAPALTWRCGVDGREEWVVPEGWEVPAEWTAWLRSIHADVEQTPRSLSLPVLVGHLSSGVVEGDPRAPLLRVGPALCGDVTWIISPCETGACVRGASGGGLMLPLVIALAALADSAVAPDALQLRAYAGRDGDRVEALRQLARSDQALDIATLRRRLLGDDSDRLTAIRALTRCGAAAELPRILAAAQPGMPMATLAARDAVAELWWRATARVRDAVMSAIRQHENAALRDLDVEELTAARALETTAATAPDLRGRAWVMLMCTGFGLLGLWNRARVPTDRSLSTPDGITRPS